MNGLTLLGLIGMGWLAFSLWFGIGIGRALHDPANDDLDEWEAELSRSSRETGMRQHPAGGSR